MNRSVGSGLDLPAFLPPGTALELVRTPEPAPLVAHRLQSYPSQPEKRKYLPSAVQFPEDGGGGGRVAQNH